MRPDSKQKLQPDRQRKTKQSTCQRRSRQAAPLERGRIVSAALSIVDHEGLKALSMRRLGSELGVDPMAVYYYLPNKQALLDAIVEAVMAAVDLSVIDCSQPPEERIFCAARAYADALLAHANALPILLVHGPVTADALRPVELLTGILRDAGLPPEKALSGMNAIAAAVRGYAGMVSERKASLKEWRAFRRSLPAAEFPYLVEALAASDRSFDHALEFGIRALVRGLLA